MSNPYRQDIIDLVTSNKKQYTYAEVGAQFNISPEQVRNVARNNGLTGFFRTKNCNGIIGTATPRSLTGVKPMNEQLTNAEVREVVRAEQEARIAKERGTLSDRKYKALLADYERVIAENEAMTTIAMAKSNPIDIKPRLSKKEHEAVPLIVLSDWHCEERVDPRTIGNKNKYNLDVARARSTRIFQSALKLMKEKENDVTINDVAVFLLGDFITGNIHEENVENAMLLPVEACLFAQDLIEGGIDFLLTNTTWNYTFYCKVGNHSRITPKVRASTELGNSLELAVYVSMMKKYQGNPRVRFHLEPSYISTVKILNTRVRFHHGHAVSYGGGVGGLHIPLRKAIKSWNENERADLDIMGHYHSFIEHSTLKYMVNGSLIGYNAYAERIKCPLEPPLQGFALIHKKYGVTNMTPIYGE